MLMVLYFVPCINAGDGDIAVIADVSPRPGLGALNVKMKPDFSLRQLRVIGFSEDLLDRLRDRAFLAN